MLQKPKSCFRTRQAEHKHSRKIEDCFGQHGNPRMLSAQCFFGTFLLLGVRICDKGTARVMDLLGKVTLSTLCQKSQAASPTNSTQVGFHSLSLVASLPAFLVDALLSHSTGMLFSNLRFWCLETVSEDAFTSRGKP